MPVESSDSGERLTSWPPKAAVHDSVTQEGSKRREKRSFSQEQQATGDVITLDDIESLTERKINNHPYEERKSLAKASSMGSEQRHSASVPTSNMGSEQRHSASVPARQNESLVREDAGEKTEISQIRSAKEPKESTLHQVSMSKVKEHSVEKQWLLHNAPDFRNVQSVDITDLMKTVAIDDSVPLAGELLLPNEGGQTSKEAVGRWGECFVYNYLKHLKVLPNGINITGVQWVNKVAETGDPYDLTVVTETEEMWYVEVKATSSMDKELIPISWREIKFAEKEGQRYYLYRLFNAGKSLKEMHLMYLQNLVGHLDTNPAARLFLTL